MERKLIIPVLLTLSIGFITACFFQSCKETKAAAAVMYIPIIKTVTNTVTKLKHDTVKTKSQYDANRIGKALDKIDRIDKLASDMEVINPLIKGYFRVVDSLRHARAQSKSKDTTIDYLRNIINNQHASDLKLSQYGDNIDKLQSQVVSQSKENRDYKKANDILIYSGFAVILLVQILGLLLNKRKRS